MLPRWFLYGCNVMKLLYTTTILTLLYLYFTTGDSGENEGEYKGSLSEDTAPEERMHTTTLPLYLTYLEARVLLWHLHVFFAILIVIIIHFYSIKVFMLMLFESRDNLMIPLRSVLSYLIVLTTLVHFLRCIFAVLKDKKKKQDVCVMRIEQRWLDG